MKLGTLASSIGISYSTMDSIINGNVDEMRIGVDKVLAIAEYFGVTVEELYGRPVVQKNRGSARSYCRFIGRGVGAYKVMA
jgi:DNA-binding XRE family transcriptional regulator